MKMIVTIIITTILQHRIPTSGQLLSGLSAAGKQQEQLHSQRIKSQNFSTHFSMSPIILGFFHFKFVTFGR